MQTDHSGGPYSPNHPDGQTHGTPERPIHRVINPLVAFDLTGELAAMRSELGWAHDSHNPKTKTLVKEPTLRIVLIALRQGGRLAEHRAPGRISIQTLAGRLRLHALDQDVELHTGGVLILDPNMPHDVEALDESAFLLTIAWPDGNVAS